MNDQTEREKKREKFAQTRNLRYSAPDKVNKNFSDRYLKGDGCYMKLNKKLIEFMIIRKICNKLKIDPFFILIACLIPLVILLFVYFTITTTMIAIIYPLYKSFKALEKKKVIINIKLEEQETTRWLSYWLMYAFINNMECIFWKFLEKIQFYNLFKFIFLILCFIPQVNLSVIIYNFITSEIYDKYGEKFEKNALQFFNKIFGNKKTETINNEIANKCETGELIDDDFAKRKKNE